MIRVSKVGDGQYDVTVEQRSTTTHAVRVSQDYYQSLTAGTVSCEELVEKSFAFLLERESNTSILSSFELPVIGRYFPEYERTMKSQFSGGSG